MKSTFLWVGVAVAAIALLVAAPASAHGNDAWWTTDYAESLLLDSDWSFSHDIQDSSCKGWGSFKLSSDGAKTYRRFVCTAYAEVTQQQCLPGECTSDTTTTTCNYRLKLLATNADTFLLAGVRSNCG